MNINGKTVTRPTLEDMHNKYRGLFQKLEILLDESILQDTQNYLIELEWCDLFYELINREHGGDLSEKRKRQEYERFYENILEEYLKLKPYFYFSKAPKINIPYKQPDTHQKLETLLADDRQALSLIHDSYPFIRKRKNKREFHNERMERMMDIMQNNTHYIKAAKWIYIEPVKDKVFNFLNIFSEQALKLKDKKGNDYLEFEKVTITSIDKNITLIKDIDYEIHSWGTIIILSPLLHKCSNIQVIISTKRMKFKQITT
jgi:hypothetical protein